MLKMMMVKLLRQKSVYEVLCPGRIGLSGAGLISLSITSYALFYFGGVRMIHTSIADKDLPECLKRKLVFGDRKQIDALNTLEIEILEQEAETEKHLFGELKHFNVEVEFSGYTYVKVWANSKKHAEELAEEMGCSASDCDDMQIDGYYAMEIKQDKVGHKGG